MDINSRRLKMILIHHPRSCAGVDVVDMAKAVATIGLVSSIASLVENSAKVASWLCKFTSKTSDIRESFRSLSIRLPLMTATLQRIQIQAEAGRLPDDAHTLSLVDLHPRTVC